MSTEEHIKYIMTNFGRQLGNHSISERQIKLISQYTGLNNEEVICLFEKLSVAHQSICKIERDAAITAVGTLEDREIIRRNLLLDFIYDTINNGIIHFEDLNIIFKNYGYEEDALSLYQESIKRKINSLI
ncbi:hypothetical protein KBE46_02545 [Candidatus Saccharibacteria bacterium]|nr:hypothetical protein [Candidatus Saccharibacteria bacterium]MBP9552384.1 hypothetical protein [Candidatus Saccharibacteria bacterium]